MMRKLAIVLIVIGVIGIIFTAKPYFTSSTGEDAQSYISEPIEHIIITSTHANIQVLPTDLDTIVVSHQSLIGIGESSSLDEKITVDETTGTLNINLAKSTLFNISLFNFQWANREKLIVHLPKKQYESIKVDNNVGKTSIQNIRVDQLVAENDVGNIVIENIVAESIESINNVGNITLKNITAEILAKNDVGNISVITDDIINDMTYVSNVGKINLKVSKVPKDVNFIANTSLGNVSIFGGSGSNIVGHGKYSVSMTTDIGNIKVTTK